MITSVIYKSKPLAFGFFCASGGWWSLPRFIRLALLSMPRMEIELTSTSDDGTWTWRAAGAKLPKGSLDGSLLNGGESVGDVLKVETEQFVDGITVTSVLTTRAPRSAPELLEMLGSGKETPLVTSTLASKKGRRGDNDRRDDKRRDKKDGDRRGPRNRTDRKPRRENKDGDRKDSRKPRQDRPQRTAPPRAKRLRPRHTHRDAAVAALPEELQLLGRQLSRNGVPGLRTEIAKQNAAAEAAGEPAVPEALLLKLAERIQPSLRTADWQDRAEAALKGVADLDLRDLRSVVVAAETAAKTDDTRELAGQLRTELTGRVDREHAEWQAEVASTLADGRMVRALRLSSHPPKAGAPLPGDLLEKLAQGAAEGLSSDTGQDRWGTVLDAVALSPVRGRVVPAGIPAEPNKELLELVTRLSMQVPAIAALFGIAPTAPPRNKRRRGPRS